MNLEMQVTRRAGTAYRSDSMSGSGVVKPEHVPHFRQTAVAEVDYGLRGLIGLQAPSHHGE